MCSGFTWVDRPSIRLLDNDPYPLSLPPSSMQWRGYHLVEVKSELIRSEAHLRHMHALSHHTSNTQSPSVTRPAESQGGSVGPAPQRGGVGPLKERIFICHCLHALVPLGVTGLVIVKILQFRNLRIPDSRDGAALSNCGFGNPLGKLCSYPINVKNCGLVSSVGCLGLRNSVVKAIRGQGRGSEHL